MSSDTLILSEAATPTRNPRRRRIEKSSLVLAVILTSQLMVVLDATIVNVALPDMKASLHFSDAALSWVLNAYTLTFGGLLLLGARAGDILGRRSTFLAGIGLFTVASLVGGFATTGWFLLAARALQGVGGALAAPSSLALLTTMFPEGRERLRAIGLFTAVSIGGGAIGLISGGMLTEWASWRWVLFVNVPIGAAVFAIGSWVLPQTQRLHGRFDFTGALTSTLGMGALVYGFVRAATEGWSDPITIGSFGAGVVLLTAFVFTELRAEEPITPLRLLTDPSRTGANVARGLLFAGMFGMFFFLTQFLQDVLGYSPLQTGFAFLPIPLTVFVSSQLASRVLVNRVNGKALMLVGIGLSTLGLLLSSQLSAESSYPNILICLLLFGAGNGLSFVTLTSAALAGVAPTDAGAASGLVNVTQQLGGTLGVAVLVTVFGSASKHAAAHPLPGASAISQANHAFVYGADRAFVASTLFLVAAIALVAVAVRAPRAAPTA
jgi:EmrB/QacA subfamily drug resistance transporter